LAPIELLMSPLSNVRLPSCRLSAEAILIAPLLSKIIFLTFRPLNVLSDNCRPAFAAAAPPSVINPPFKVSAPPDI